MHVVTDVFFLFARSYQVAKKKHMEAQCIVCDYRFMDYGHTPRRQTCQCRTRVCDMCAPSLPNPDQCPTCRSLSLTQELDETYVHSLCVSRRSVVCEACHNRVSTRSLSCHQKACAPYLEARLKELQKEHQHLLQTHRKLVQTNTNLRSTLDHDDRIIAHLSMRVQALENSISGQGLRG